jgi:hypothetical protein
MPKTTLTLSEPVAKTLKVYTVQSKSSMRAQSQVVEEALIEFFERHNAKIEPTFRGKAGMLNNFLDSDFSV